MLSRLPGYGRVQRAPVTRAPTSHVEALMKAFGDDKLELNSRARTVVFTTGPCSTQEELHIRRYGRHPLQKR